MRVGDLLSFRMQMRHVFPHDNLALLEPFGRDCTDDLRVEFGLRRLGRPRP
jgi:hypothetical protein